ncbi:unnamed protein product [Umbelopsis vinacea]
MQKQQKQQMKFVIRSKLQDLGGDQPASAEESEHVSPIPATNAMDAAKLLSTAPDEAMGIEETEKERTRCNTKGYQEGTHLD